MIQRGQTKSEDRRAHGHRENARHDGTQQIITLQTQVQRQQENRRDLPHGRTDQYTPPTPPPASGPPTNVRIST